MDNTLVKLAMFGWIPVTLGLFALLRPRTALLVSMTLGWLLLPMGKINLPGLPDLTKPVAVSIAALAGVLVFDARILRTLTWRPGWVDVPAIVWCLSPILTAISNIPELTLYDGYFESLRYCLWWGVPYLLGRLYFSDAESLRELATAIFAGGLLYVPLCLFEMKQSPQLHNMVYGFHQHDFAQTMRSGGWRPMVFLQHGIAVAMFMTAASLAGLWLWRTGAVRTVARLPVWPFVAILLGTTVLLKSAAALGFLVIGVAVLFAVRWTRAYMIVLALMLVPMAYVTARVCYRIDTDAITRAASKVFRPDRIQSLQFRLENETPLVEKAAEKPWLGWGGYGRFLIRDRWGFIQTVPDSQWIIALGECGVVGVAAFFLMILPAVRATWCVPRPMWGEPHAAGVTFTLVLLALFALDNLINAMPNHLFMLALGGLSGIPVIRERSRASHRRAQTVEVVEVKHAAA